MRNVYIIGGFDMIQKKLKDVKKGDFFCLNEYDDSQTEVDEKKVWIRGDYERSEKKYSCIAFVDHCKEKFIKGDRVVYTEIYF